MKFRRKSAENETDPADDAPVTPDGWPSGPRDSADPNVEEGERADLGSLRIPQLGGADLRLQVDEESGQILAVMITAEEGLVEMRAFSAPRNGDLWAEARPEIAADTESRGGTATEQDGPFGVELLCVVPVELAEGEQGVHPSRVIGVNGPRWFFRATFVGRPAVDAEYAAPWEEAVRHVVVHRGSEAMPSGEALPLRLPDDAQRVDNLPS